MEAVRNGHSEIVKYLIDNGSFTDCSSILLEVGNLEIIQYLIENCNFSNEKLDNALQISAIQGSLEIVTFLIDNGANLQKYINTLLCECASLGLLNMVIFLVENGALVNYENDNALIRACANGHNKTVAFLLENDEAIAYAAEDGNLELVKMLLKCNNVNIYNDALWMSINNGHLQISKLLIENGFTINKDDHVSIMELLNVQLEIA